MQKLEFILTDYISESFSLLPLLHDYSYPWEITTNSAEIVKKLILDLGDDYNVENEVAVHKTAVIENNVVFKGPTIVGEACIVAANSYFREGVYLSHHVIIGPSSEIKASFIFPYSAIAHLNYVGNSLIGSHVNIEGGAILAVHFNERENKEIIVKIDGQEVKTGVEKFGSLIGDNSKIGANAVINPGQILRPNTIIDRLQLLK